MHTVIVVSSPGPSLNCDPDFSVVHLLGATWWEDMYEKGLKELEVPKDMDVYIKMGWPAGGGVCVLYTTLEEASDIGVAIIHNTSDIEERCRLIERLVGVYYADPRACPYLDLP